MVHPTSAIVATMRLSFMRRLYFVRGTSYTEHSWQDSNLRPCRSKRLALIPLSYKSKLFHVDSWVWYRARMDTTHSHQTNGKSLIPMSHPLLSAPSAGPPKSVSRVLELVGTAIDLEMKLKATMAELEREVEANRGDLPSVLVSLMRSQHVVLPPRPGPAKARQRKAAAPAHPKNKGGALKARILGLMSDKKERKSKQIVKELGVKNAGSVYSILSGLVREGHLMRPKFATYRLKLRS